MVQPRKGGDSGWREGMVQSPALLAVLASLAAKWATSCQTTDAQTQSGAGNLSRAYPGWVQAAGNAARPDTQCHPGQWAPGLADRPEWLQTRSDWEGGEAVWTRRGHPT